MFLEKYKEKNGVKDFVFLMQIKIKIFPICPVYIFYEKCYLPLNGLFDKKCYMFIILDFHNRSPSFLYISKSITNKLQICLQICRFWQIIGLVICQNLQIWRQIHNSLVGLFIYIQKPWWFIAKIKIIKQISIFVFWEAFFFYKPFRGDKSFREKYILVW